MEKEQRKTVAAVRESPKKNSRRRSRCACLELRPLRQNWRAKTRRENGKQIIQSMEASGRGRIHIESGRKWQVEALRVCEMKEIKQSMNRPSDKKSIDR